MRSAIAYIYNNSVENCCKYTGNHLLHHKIGWLSTFRVTYTHWLKYMFVFYGNFLFFQGIQITLFSHRNRIHRGTQCINLCLMLFKKRYEWFLVQIECSNCCKKILSNFLCFDSFILYICYFVAVKKKKNEMSFKSSIGPSLPISEITICVCRLKKLETRLIKDQMFF